MPFFSYVLLIVSSLSCDPINCVFFFPSHVKYKYKKMKWGGAQSPPPWNWGWKGGGSTHNSHYRLGDTEQFGNVQESERYVLHVSGTKKQLSIN